MALSLSRALAASVVAGFMSAVGAHAASVPLTLVDAGPLSNGTQLFRADLTGLGLTQIGSITVEDDGTPVGGAGGIFSGFDLDGIFLDGDGDITTLGDQTFGSSFLFIAGTTRFTTATSLLPTAAHPGPTFGSLSANSIDFATATLNTIGDGVNIADVNLANGFLTLGDGGRLTVNFTPGVPVTGSLFLALGEQGGQAGEGIGASILVSEQPQVIPLPAAGWLLLAGAGALGLIARRRP